MARAVLPIMQMFTVLFVGVLGEELGWSGYILGRLQQGRRALQAGLILGAVTLAWHIVPSFVIERPR